MIEQGLLLVGERDERYEIPIASRRPIYIRPGIHLDPDAPAAEQRAVRRRCAIIATAVLVIVILIGFLHV